MASMDHAQSPLEQRVSQACCSSYTVLWQNMDNGHVCENERCMTGMNLGNYHVLSSHVEEKN